MFFYIWETGQMLLNQINGHKSTCKLLNYDLLVLIHTKFHQLCCSVCVINSLMPPWPCLSPIWNGIQTCTLIRTITWHQPLLDLTPLPSPALWVDNEYKFFESDALCYKLIPIITCYNLLLQLTKVTVLAERFSFLFLLLLLYTQWQATDMSHLRVAPSSPI